LSPRDAAGDRFRFAGEGIFIGSLEAAGEIDRRLDAEKQRLSVLDFDDLQLRALRLLDHPEVLARVSERYRYFLVDEFQDTNGLQRDLMTRLALVRGTNLFIVGDRKQVHLWFSRRRRRCIHGNDGRDRKSGRPETTTAPEFSQSETADRVAQFYLRKNI
jgi:superfamily I DNA/RNA helicase